MSRAEALGGLQWFGWDLATEYLAGLIDRATLTAKASARQKARLTESDRAPRPSPSGRGATTASTDDDSAMQALLSGL